MLSDILTMIAVLYVAAQWSLLVHLEGRWRIAAFLPAPFIASAVCLSLLTGIFDTLLSAVVLNLAVPFGAVYLMTLTVLWLIFGRGHGDQGSRNTSAP